MQRLKSPLLTVKIGLSTYPYYVLEESPHVTSFPTLVLEVVICPHCLSPVLPTKTCPACGKKLSAKHDLTPVLPQIAHFLARRPSY